jgi:hypothetical protein
MSTRIRARITYANVTATLALFIALGGSAYAVVRLPHNSVGPKQLKRGAVNGAKVKDQSLTGKDINLGLLGTVPSATNAKRAESAKRADAAVPSGTAGGDLKGTYPKPTLAANAVSASNLAAKSVTAASLADGIPSGLKYVVASAGPDSTNKTVEAHCPAGTVPIGGGAKTAEPTAGTVALVGNHPEVKSEGSTFDGWLGRAVEIGGGTNDDWRLEVTVLCGKF